jgi:hypothetical protein
MRSLNQMDAASGCQGKMGGGLANVAGPGTELVILTRNYHWQGGAPREYLAQVADAAAGAVQDDQYHGGKMPRKDFEQVAQIAQSLAAGCANGYEEWTGIARRWELYPHF